MLAGVQPHGGRGVNHCFLLRRCGFISKLAGATVTVPMKLRLQAGMIIYRDGALVKSFFPRCR